MTTGILHEFEALHHLGVLALQGGRTEAAVEHLQAAVRLRPNSVAALNHLGLAFARQGQLDLAVSAFRQALTLQPDLLEAHVNLGNALKAQGCPDEAMHHFRQALGLDPNDAAVHRCLAVVLTELGQLEDAIGHYQQAIRLQPAVAATHNNLGTLLASQRRLGEAEACFRRALQLKADYAVAMGNLANTLADLDQLDEAVAWCRRALTAHPEDANLRFLLAALTGEQAPAAPPREYVAAMFDGYAARFDEHLVQAHRYRGPQLLRDAVADLSAGTLLDILDLGCGTGLCGLAFRDRARTLTGVDLSSQMLARAKMRGIYDRLIQEDLRDALRAAPESYDLILAADVFIYVGDLAAVFPAVAAALRPGGHFALCVEALDGEGFRLRPSRRYAHSADYNRRLASDCGLTETHMQEASLRAGPRGDIEGLVFVLKKGAEG
jgi:predicted TPR repeat methyltransferase